ncbi:MAG: Fic family protein [Candidatus Treponema excrementipullorum]|nr:Fic family protein [Candidatus Treponema excrementipullorum]
MRKVTDEFQKPDCTAGFDFDEYIRQVEPSKKERGKAWAAAIGLQQVDKLVPSSYLYETARRNIEGEISIDEANQLIDSYYERKSSRSAEEERTEEADKVAARIARILGEKSFRFSPSYLIALHKELFYGIYRFAGVLRDYDITKKEWVLQGNTVLYGASFELKTALEYDFEQERQFNYKNLSSLEIVKHISFFVSRLWQIHPFGEGNTRTTAVFTIKYLQTLGFTVSNEPFEQNSWYFRNALVRANYSDIQRGIQETPVFLENFFDNLLFGGHHELKNRYMHIAYKKKYQSGEACSVEDGGCVPYNDTVNVSVNDRGTVSVKENTNAGIKISENMHIILNAIRENPCITQNELAEKIGVSVRSIIRNMKKLQEAGLVRRVGADKNGYWKVQGENDGNF